VTNSLHTGLDVTSNRKPAPILAAWDGKVVAKLPKEKGGGTGNVIVVEYKYEDIPPSQRPENLQSGQSVYVYYGHQTDDGYNMKNLGETIQTGEQFGEVGKTGEATGYHIHMEVRIGTSGLFTSEEYVNKNKHFQWSKYGEKQNPELIFSGICG
jgi:murein DD-endopeptidase MepM/ murein hydrolase activator NlpD